MTWWRRLLQRGRVERQLDAELRDHFERLVADYRQCGGERTRGAPPRAAGVRRPRAGQGRLPRRARHALARRDRPGSALRPAAPSPQSGLHAGRRRLARARHRRQQRDLRAGRRRPAEVAAGPRAGAARAARRRIVDQPDLGAAARPAARVGRRRRGLVRRRASICRAAAPPSSSRACGRAADSSRCSACRRCSGAPSRPPTISAAAARTAPSR